jgi:hypothetical protein
VPLDGTEISGLHLKCGEDEEDKQCFRGVVLCAARLIEAEFVAREREKRERLEIP